MSYLELASDLYTLLFNTPKSYSMGFSYGEYYALNTTEAPNLCQVSLIRSYLCIRALSISSTMVLLA
jgi:hypothetical protein